MYIKTSNNKTTQHTIRSFRTWTNVGSCGCNIFDSLVYWSCRHAIVRIARFYRVDLLTSMENTTNTYQRSYRESHFFLFFLALYVSTFSLFSAIISLFFTMYFIYDIYKIRYFAISLKKTFIFLPHLRFKTIWFTINTRMGELVQHESTVSDCDSPNEWKPCSICLASANRKVDNFQIVIFNRKWPNITNYRNSVNCRPPVGFIWF